MSDLHADELRHDPRIAEARKLIRAAVEEHRQKIDAVRPPAESLQTAYESQLDQMGELRGGTLYYRYLGSGLGNGALVELADGSVKYDMISGIGVHVAGHTDPDLVDACVEAAVCDTVMQGNLQQNLDSLRLCDEIVSLACESGADLPHCFLSTSGATANENALKIIFQNRAPADRILTFANGFAGRTLALAQVTDRPGNREGLPPTIAVDYVPFFDASDHAGSIDRSVSTLKELTARYPGRHAGMCMELIQGEGGYNTAPREFFLALIEHLRERDILLFTDEIQTFGRTTRAFAFQELQLDQFVDVATIGKMSQICATLFRDRLKPRPGLVSQTFTGATSAIHAAASIVQRLRTGGHFGADGRNDAIHARFVKHFEEIRAAHPDWITGPWGRGGMVALTVFDGSADRTKQFLRELFDRGVIAFPAGSHPTRVRMLPPLLAIRDEDIDATCTLIAQVLESQA